MLKMDRYYFGPDYQKKNRYIRFCDQKKCRNKKSPTTQTCLPSAKSKRPRTSP